MSLAWGSVAGKPQGISPITYISFCSIAQSDRPLIDDYLFPKSVHPSPDAYQGRIILSKTYRIICQASFRDLSPILSMPSFRSIHTCCNRTQVSVHPVRAPVVSRSEYPFDKLGRTRVKARRTNKFLGAVTPTDSSILG